MKTLIVVGLLLSVVSAWWDHGHLLTARIAENILEKEDPETYNSVLQILSKLKETDPNWTVNEKDHPFTECATYADFIKGKTGGQYQKGWHFIDEPFLNEGGKISDYNFTFDDHNITEVVSALVDWFQQNPGYQNSYEYAMIMNNTYKDHSELNGQSTAMRFLIHYVGDIHQPLHSTSRVNHEYPKGDFGGNFVHLPDKEGAHNLHAVWDSVAYEFCGYANLPFSQSDWDELSQTAIDLVQKYDISEEEATSLDVKKWAHEAFELSKSVVYPGITENVMPSDEYITKAKAVAEKQVVLGGYRLANLLQSLNLQAQQPESPSMLSKLKRGLNSIVDQFIQN